MNFNFSAPLFGDAPLAPGAAPAGPPAFVPLTETLGDAGHDAVLQTDLTIGFAGNFADRLAAFSLVHAEYVRKGFVPPDRDGGHWCRAHDLLPDGATCILRRGERVRATLSVIVDGELGLPCEDIFAAEVTELRGAGRRLCEFTSLASELSSARESAYALAGMMRLVVLVSRHLRLRTDLLIAVNPRHVGYYQQKLLFQIVAGPRSFEKVNGAPAVLLRLDMETAPHRYSERFGPTPDSAYVHYFQTNRRQRDLLEWLLHHVRPLDAETLGQLIAAGLHQCPLKERPELAAILAANYPTCRDALLSARVEHTRAA